MRTQKKEKMNHEVAVIHSLRSWINCRRSSAAEAELNADCAAIGFTTIEAAKRCQSPPLQG
jgi:hypothetical protein